MPPSSKLRPLVHSFFSKQLHGRLLLKIYLTEHLEVTDVRYGVGPDILRVEIEKVEDLSEEL